MGMMVDGEWHDVWYDTSADGGRFVRKDSQFRNWVTRDGSPGPSGVGGFTATRGRYHLYVAMPCPWAHRTLIFRALKRLESHVTVTVLGSTFGSQGWVFNPESTETEGAPHASYLYDIYRQVDPGYTGQVTIPVLWDKQTQTIVNNESSEIIRMFNSAFDDVGAEPGDFYPDELRSEIDAMNGVVYDRVNNGVYRAGFASSQEAYDEAVGGVFDTLDHLEAKLGEQRYLCGGRVTEADWRLLTTLLRFDAAYVGAFKCNLRRLVEYPNLWGLTRELFQWPGVSATLDLEQVKRCYFSLPAINPTGVIPLGPILDLTAPHERDIAFPPNRGT